MAGDVKVVEDGVERQRQARRSTSPWVWLITGLVVGLGIGVVFLTPPATDGVDPSPDVVTPTLPTIEEPDEGGGIAGAVPDFPDALVAVVEGGGHSLEYLLWPLAGEPTTRSLPGGDFGEVALGPTGRWVAIATNVPDADGFVLSMGLSSGVRPIASDVTSFAWHDSEPGVLSFTQIVDGEWLLWVVRPDLNPGLVTQGVGIDGRVLAWGDWGWVIDDLNKEGEVSLLNNAGELRTTTEGFAYDSHPSGWVVIVDDGVSLVSSGGGVQRLDLSIESISPVITAALSPDGERIAVLGVGGLRVAPVDGDGEVIQMARTVGPSDLAWSSDSRYVLVPLPRGVVAVDSHGINPPELVMNTKTALALGVIPLIHP